MKLLVAYLKDYWRLVALALVLAAINQVFSLLDPLIFRHVIDEYATKFKEYTTAEFFQGVSVLLAAAVGVAFVSRVAKNFQDYYINVITQRLGAQLYSDGIRHSLELPYSVFEDQRSGETLGRLQKVRTDVEKLIATSINVLFTSLVGIVFVMTYAFSVHWLIAPVYFLTVPILGVLSSVLSRRIKQIQKVIVAETTALAGSIARARSWSATCCPPSGRAFTPRCSASAIASRRRTRPVSPRRIVERVSAPRSRPPAGAWVRRPSLTS